jgi:hypothetical protein
MHPECVEERTRVLMSCLGPTIGMHGGVLAGGTGLALDIGHRMSEGLEFFTQRPFRAADILEELRALAGTVEPLSMESDVMTVRADDALLSLVQASARFNEPTARVNGCDVAGVVDIAGMNLMNISRSGTRNDFVDLYALLQTMPFRKVARNALERYGLVAVDPLAVGKGLVWFERADIQDQAVFVGTPVDWGDIRKYFQSSVHQFVLDLDAEGKSLKWESPKT